MKYSIKVYEFDSERPICHIDQLNSCTTIEISARSKLEAIEKAHEIYAAKYVPNEFEMIIWRIGSRKMAVMHCKSASIPYIAYR